MAAAGIISAVTGCSAVQEESSASSEDAIINGADATSSSYNAIGALGHYYTVGFRSFCTATLIAPKVVLTAKHCALDDPTNPTSPTQLDAGPTYFLVGPNSQQPEKVVQAKAITTSSIFHGGFTGLGSDVAIYELAEPITDITPLKVNATPPSAAQVGESFIAMGYGVQDARGRSGTRKFGKVTMRAVAGAPAPMAFANVDAYVASIQAFNPEAPLTPEQIDSIRAGWTRPMLDDYEVYTGNATADVQVCNGDSGGPLLHEESGELVVYGVASTTMAKTGYLCSNGGMYATFGANTRHYIAKAIGQECWPNASGTLECGAPSSPPRVCSFLETTTPANVPAEGGEAFMSCLRTECCAETTACLGDQECSTLQQCFNTCAAAPPPAGAEAGSEAATAAVQQCSTECYRQRPNAYGRYLGFALCADSCAPATH